MEYFIHYIKFKMWPVLFYVNSRYFQQENSNWVMIYFSLSLDWILGFLNVGLGFTSIFFLIHIKKIGNLHLVMQISNEILIFECKLGCISFQISANSLRSWKIGIFELCLLSYVVRLCWYYFKLGMWLEEGEPICD